MKNPLRFALSTDVYPYPPLLHPIVPNHPLNAPFFIPAHSTINNGAIAEEGTYQELVQRNGAFQRLMEEFGGQELRKEEDEEEGAASSLPVNSRPSKKITRKTMGKAAGTGKLEGRLMVSEVRKTGSVGRKVYGGYLKAGRARWTLPATLAAAILMQGAQILSTLWLTYWQGDRFHQVRKFASW